MSFTRLTLQIERILTFAAIIPNTEQLIYFLRRNVDPIGENAEILILELGQNDYFQLYSYERTIQITGLPKSFSLSEDHPVLEAFFNSRNIILDLKNPTVNHSDFYAFLNLEQFKHIWILPVTSDKALFILIRSKLNSFKNLYWYFSSCKSIITLWSKSYNFSSNASQYSKPGFKKDLTSRQAQILDFIKESKTNLEIANLIGYSESLIRQETIKIYRKLGVNGRREILSRVS